MPELARRGAVHVIVISLIVAALAPQTMAAPQSSPVSEQLLAAIAASPSAATFPRGTTSERTLAAFTTTADAAPLFAEHLPSGGTDLPPTVASTPALIGSPIQWVTQPGGGSAISGTASWYCCTRGWGDAAVVALPTALGGHYYAPPGGGSVVVCAERCARLPIGDACGCHWGRVGQKVIDLSPAAWAAISDKDRYVYGILSVTVYLD